MKRKLFGIFLSLALVLSMMPMGLIAAQAAEDSYNLWLGDVQVTSENMNSIPGVTGGTASYDPVNHVLTMTNVTAINGVHTISSYESAKIYSVGDLTIKGSCKIDASQTTYGIRANGNLTLDADLEVNDAESLGVSVEGAKNIIINSGKINISSDTSLYGLIGGTGSTLTIKDGDITIESHGHDEYGNGNGIDVGTFEMKGGKLSVVGHAVGLFAYRFYQTGGSIYAEGQISPGILVGNSSNPALEIKGDVEAVTKSEDRSAIQSFKSSIYINSNYYIKKPAGAHTDWSGNGQIIVNSDQTPAKSVIITIKPTPYSLWIAGTQVTSANAGDLSDINGVSVADGGEAKYNAETKTLALKDVTISNSNNSRNAKELAGIYSEDPLTISVTGTNTINGGTCTDSGEPCGIYSVKTLTFNGDGILTSTGGTGSEGVRSVGIHSSEAITFGGTGTINAMGAAAGYSSCGVRGAGAITVNSGTLNASGANGSGADSKGINAYSSGEIVINGGIVTATGYTCALNKAPTLGNGITAGGSTDISGSGAEIYKASNNANYKWVTAPFTTLGVNVSVVDVEDEFMLEGATMQVVETSGTGAETVVDEWSSTSEPHKITGLKTGVEYVLRETVPPGGYTLAGDVTFTIDETGKVTSTGTITEDGTLLVENEKTPPATCKASVYIYDNTEKASDQGGKVRFENNENGSGFEIQKPVGTSVTLTAVPDSGYTFVAWREGGTEGDELSKSTEYTFTMQDNPGGTGIWAVFEKKTTPDPSGGGGGGGGGAPSYKVEVPDDVENGSVSVSPKSAKEGDPVTITAAPDEAYTVEDMKVTDKDGKEIEVKDNGDGTYSFVMPASEVSIEPVFAVDKEAHDKVCPSKAFDDLDTSLWYHEGTDFVISEGMMNGVDEKTFAPNDTTTRAMIVTILWRMEGEPEAEAASFTDLTQDWYKAAVGWAAANGIVNGYSETSFGPNDPITREQLAAILFRYAEYKDNKGEDYAVDLSKYEDASAISDWAVDAMTWCVASGIIGGVTETTLVPQGSATRAQVATILMRYCN